MVSAPASEATASPTRVLTPSRLAPAAPANAPCGTASATNAAPRSTTKKPTTPATAATIVATTQVLAMNPENMPVTPLPAGWAGRRAGLPAGHRAVLAAGRPDSPRRSA